MSKADDVFNASLEKEVSLGYKDPREAYNEAYLQALQEYQAFNEQASPSTSIFDGWTSPDNELGDIYKGYTSGAGILGSALLKQGQNVADATTLDNMSINTLNNYGQEQQLQEQLNILGRQLGDISSGQLTPEQQVIYNEMSLIRSQLEQVTPQLDQLAPVNPYNPLNWGGNLTNALGLTRPSTERELAQGYTAPNAFKEYMHEFDTQVEALGSGDDVQAFTEAGKDFDRLTAQEFEKGNYGKAALSFVFGLGTSIKEHPEALPEIVAQSVPLMYSMLKQTIPTITTLATENKQKFTEAFMEEHEGRLPDEQEAAIINLASVAEPALELASDKLLASSLNPFKGSKLLDSMPESVKRAFGGVTSTAIKGVGITAAQTMQEAATGASQDVIAQYAAKQGASPIDIAQVSEAGRLEGAGGFGMSAPATSARTLVEALNSFSETVDKPRVKRIVEEGKVKEDKKKEKELEDTLPEAEIKDFTESVITDMEANVEDLTQEEREFLDTIKANKEDIPALKELLPELRIKEDIEAEQNKKPYDSAVKGFRDVQSISRELSGKEEKTEEDINKLTEAVNGTIAAILDNPSGNIKAIAKGIGAVILDNKLPIEADRKQLVDQLAKGIRSSKSVGLLSKIKQALPAKKSDVRKELNTLDNDLVKVTKQAVKEELKGVGDKNAVVANLIKMEAKYIRLLGNEKITEEELKEVENRIKGVRGKVEALLADTPNYDKTKLINEVRNAKNNKPVEDEKYAVNLSMLLGNAKVNRDKDTLEVIANDESIPENVRNSASNSLNYVKTMEQVHHEYSQGTGGSKEARGIQTLDSQMQVAAKQGDTEQFISLGKKLTGLVNNASNKLKALKLLKDALNPSTKESALKGLQDMGASIIDYKTKFPGVPNKITIPGVSEPFYYGANANANKLIDIMELEVSAGNSLVEANRQLWRDKLAAPQSLVEAQPEATPTTGTTELTEASTSPVETVKNIQVSQEKYDSIKAIAKSNNVDLLNTISESDYQLVTAYNEGNLIVKPTTSPSKLTSPSTPTPSTIQATEAPVGSPMPSNPVQKTGRVEYLNYGVNRVKRLRDPDAVDIMRGSIYGNPFGSNGVVNTRAELPNMGSVATVSNLYDSWLRGTLNIDAFTESQIKAIRDLEPKRIEILKSIRDGKLSGKKLIYFNKNNDGINHAEALAKLVEKHESNVSNSWVNESLNRKAFKDPVSTKEKIKATNKSISSNKGVITKSLKGLDNPNHGLHSLYKEADAKRKEIEKIENINEKLAKLVELKEWIRNEKRNPNRWRNYSVSLQDIEIDTSLDEMVKSIEEYVSNPDNNVKVLNPINGYVPGTKSIVVSKEDLAGISQGDRVAVIDNSGKTYYLLNVSNITENNGILDYGTDSVSKREAKEAYEKVTGVPYDKTDAVIRLDSLSKEELNNIALENILSKSESVNIVADAEGRKIMAYIDLLNTIKKVCE